MDCDSDLKNEDLLQMRTESVITGVKASRNYLFAKEIVSDLTVPIYVNVAMKCICIIICNIIV